jgi:hypothetical protein
LVNSILPCSGLLVIERVRLTLTKITNWRKRMRKRKRRKRRMKKGPMAVPHSLS